MDMLASIAYLHGASTNEVMDKLYQRADGWKGDYIHPRFIACMIRLGDLLDFDSDRFDEYSLALLKNIPDTSVIHKEKHSSVRHMLVSPTSIEAELNCKTDAVYRVARKWFDWLEDEVSFQSREWSNIAPEDLSGLPPMISKGNIKILFNGLRIKPELMNLKFAMSQQKIFNILRGGGIYRDPGFVFIREMVQNAFDASNIQLCNDIRMGTHSYALKGKKILDLQFPDDIPTEVYNQYPVDLTVRWKDNRKDTIVVICEDKGTGISEEALLHMTQKVGESNRNRIDKEEKSNLVKTCVGTGIYIAGLFLATPLVIAGGIIEASVLLGGKSAVKKHYKEVLKTERGLEMLGFYSKAKENGSDAAAKKLKELKKY